MAEMQHAPAVGIPTEVKSGEDTTAAYRALVENNKIMRGIVAEMKEIPELPSEAPTDTHALQKVEFPEDGGVLTYMDGYEYPYNGFPFFEFVDKIDIIKKIQRAALSSMYHSFKRRPKYQLALLVFVPWIFTDLVKAYIASFYRMVERFKLKPKRYCVAMREFHRAMSVGWHDEKQEVKEVRHQVRDIICMFMEFDNAYRFRFQDVIVELDKENLKKNPGKEIARLLALMQSREATQEIKDTWTLVLSFLPIFLRFNPLFRKTIIGVLTEIDLTKVALSVTDKFFCGKRTDYKFGFM